MSCTRRKVALANVASLGLSKSVAVLRPHAVAYLYVATNERTATHREIGNIPLTANGHWPEAAWFVGVMPRAQ